MKVDNSLEDIKIDDTPPELKFPISSVTATHTLLLAKHGRNVALFTLIYIVLIFSVVWFFGGEAIFLVYFIIPPVFLIGYWGKMLHAQVEQKFFEQFAKVNGYSYVNKMNELPLTGALFLPSSENFLSQKNGWLEHVISGEFKNKKVRLYSFCQPGRNDSVMKRTVFEIDYDTPLPRMLLKPDWHMTYVKPIFKKEHHLSLEGDFDQHFDLYVEKDFEIEALQIFTPDIMHRLQTDWRRLVIEFSHDSIFIYTMTVLSKKKDLEHIYSCAKYLIEKLSPVSQRMESGLVAMQQRFKR
jgi:hypothetical protein